LFFHFSSTVTTPTLVGFFVKGQTSITQDASIGFSILIICHGVVPAFLICLVTIPTHSINTLLSSFNTFNTFACFHLSTSFQAITCTKSQTLIFI
jgi:hypothetical protein